jgi:ATP phosphoribosyltransferase
MSEAFTFALPSKGAIADPTYSFLKDIGLKVSKPNPRQYTGSIATVPHCQVLFQRVKDVVYKVADGTAQLGVTGLDVVYENPHDDLIVVHDKLGYGHCRLVVAVPESWVDVESIYDLAEVALDFREKKGRNIRIATTYTHLTRQFFQKNRVQHFTLVKAEGAIEAAPTIGYADFIVDLTQTGTTLRENHLKEIGDGTIVEAQACLVANKQALRQIPSLMQDLQYICELIDAGLQAKSFYQVIIDIPGDDIDAIAKQVNDNPITHGAIAPTVSPIYREDDTQWHTLTITIHQKDVIPAVRHLRAIGAQHIIINPIKYLFQEASTTYQALVERLEAMP